MKDVAELFKALAELIQAFAALLWPILAVVIGWLFKPEICQFIARLRKWKFFGQEVELAESLQHLHRDAVRAAAEIEQLEATPTVSKSADGEASISNDDDLMNVAAQSPRAALMMLSSRIEKELRDLLLSSGYARGMGNITLHQGIKQLEAKRGLPLHLSSAVELFLNVRNRIVHGHSSTDNDVFSAIDSGRTILNALRGIPYSIYVVCHPSVPIYADSEWQNIISGVKAVILEATTKSGKTKRKILPTTRTHFKRGMRVAWESSFERTWGEAWYCDPDTEKISKAWVSSAEFIGRDLDDGGTRWDG